MGLSGWPMATGSTARCSCGMTLMLDAAQGGYSPQIGWDPSNREAVEVIPTGNGREPEEGQGSDLLSTRKAWVTLADHTRHVVTETDTILRELSGLFPDSSIPEVIGVAALYHDAGKAHPAFQEMLAAGERVPAEGVLMAKSPRNGKMDPCAPALPARVGKRSCRTETCGCAQRKRLRLGRVPDRLASRQSTARHQVPPRTKDGLHRQQPGSELSFGV